MPNSPNSNSNEEENVWVVDTKYKIPVGNTANVTAEPDQVNYLKYNAATPKKQVKINPYNQIGPVVLLGYKGKNPQTPPKQKPVAYGKKPKTPQGKKKPFPYGGRRKTRKQRRSSRKTIKRRN